MMQVARNLTDAEDGFLMGKRHALMDRDGKFCPALRAILKSSIWWRYIYHPGVPTGMLPSNASITSAAISC